MKHPHDELRKKTWKETTRDVVWFGHTFTVSYPKLTDARLIQISVLLLVNILGQVVFHFSINPVQILLLLLTCIYFDTILTFITKEIIIFPTSGFITALSLALLMEVSGTGSVSYLLYILAGILGISSKYFITYKNKHIFNPSNFAIVILLLVYGSVVKINPNEWPTSFWLLLPIVIIGSRLIIKAKVVTVALSFFATEAILYSLIVLSGSTGQSMSFDGLTMLSPSLYIFTFYMITDPRTAPRNGQAKILYGTAIGALHWTFAGLGFGTVSLFLGLFVICLFVPLLEKITAHSTKVFNYIH